ncbi:NAD(P) transhydrogenase [Schistosoma japonicum]|nr:NAD(P) transhydrogenase [Schistosoma japonicum]
MNRIMNTLENRIFATLTTIYSHRCPQIQLTSACYRAYSAKTESSKLGVAYTNLHIGVPKESFAGVRRVSVTPHTANLFSKYGFNVFVQSGAGSESNFLDSDYVKAGAKIIADSAESLYHQSEIILKIRPPSYSSPPKPSDEVSMLKPNTTLISLIYPGKNKISFVRFSL